MAKFKVGDRVAVTLDKAIRAACNLAEEEPARIIALKDDDIYDYAVRFDAGNTHFHTCENKCEDNHGWYVREREIRPLGQTSFDNHPKFRVIIESDGDRTTAKMLHGKEVVREAEVNRYYKDENDEQVAIKAVVAKMFRPRREIEAVSLLGFVCEAASVSHGKGYITYADGAYFALQKEDGSSVVKAFKTESAAREWLMSEEVTEGDGKIDTHHR